MSNMTRTKASYKIPTTLVLLGALLIPSTAQSQDIDVKLFDPVPGPQGILSVHTSLPLEHLALWAGLTTNYANDLLVGRQGSETNLRPVAHRLSGELALGLGLFRWVDVGISLPVYLHQVGIDYPQPGGDTARTGLGDLRLLVKGRILRNRRFGGVGLALVAELGVPTGETDAFMRRKHPTFTPRLVLDYRHPRGFVVALNIGARIQSREVVEDLAVGSELRLGLGAEAPLGPRGLSVVGEVVAAVGLTRPATDDVQRVSLRTSPLEALLALRWRHRAGLVLTVGAGVGLTEGYGAPDVRALLSLGYTFRLHRPPESRASPVVAVRRAEGPTRHTRTPPRRVAEHPPARPGPQPVTAADFDRAAATDPDPDADGLPNSRDKCPRQAEDFDGFQDTDGCPEPDNDRDGVPDVHDKCPLKPETVNGVKDDDGCPDKGAAQIVLTGSRLKISQRIYFRTGSDQLKPTAYPILRQVAAFLKARWRVRRVRIEGHTDSRGDKEKNVDLSVRRAYRVRAFLIARGVQAERLAAKGYGPKKPVASNRTPGGRAKNRRVVFGVELVVKKRGTK